MSNIQNITIGEKLLGYIGRGGWPGSTFAWGEQRVWIHPLYSTNTYDRDYFSIHGGAVPGSGGCIDLVGNIERFFNNLRYAADNSYNIIILKVQY